MPVLILRPLHLAPLVTGPSELMQFGGRVDSRKIPVKPLAATVISWWSGDKKKAGEFVRVSSSKTIRKSLLS